MICLYNNIFYPLEGSLCPELIGTSFEELESGEKFLLLSEDQENFYNNHPDASAEEIWNMSLDLDRYITKKINELEEYDKSEEVNSFYLNGTLIWLNKETRVGLVNSLTIEKKAGRTMSTLWFNNNCLLINCEAALEMLSALELYALDCYNTTALHRKAIMEINSIEELDSYNYKVNYPEKLSFNIE